MPKKAFDVFVPQSRVERLYSQLHKMRRRKGVSVKGATVPPPEKEELSSYMIDPQYMPKDTVGAGQQVVATTRSAEPVYQYSRLRNKPMKFEATPVTEPGQLATVGLLGGLKNYLYRAAEKIRQPFLRRKAKRTSAVTYTLPEGLRTGGGLRSANRTALAALAIIGLSLLAIGLANWPSGRDSDQPGQSPPVGRNGGQGAEIPAVQGAVQPPTNDNNSTGTSDPAAAGSSSGSTSTPNPKPSGGGGSGGGGSGGGGGGIIPPIEDIIPPCLDTLLDCIGPDSPSIDI
jgi:hypothetical protein